MAKAEIRKPKPKQNPLKAADVTVIDYKDVALLRKFISDRGKIPRSPRDWRDRSGAATRSLRLLRTPAKLHCCPTPALAAKEKERQ